MKKYVTIITEYQLYDYDNKTQVYLGYYAVINGKPHWCAGNDATFVGNPARQAKAAKKWIKKNQIHKTPVYSGVYKGTDRPYLCDYIMVANQRYDFNIKV